MKNITYNNIKTLLILLILLNKMDTHNNYLVDNQSFFSANSENTFPNMNLPESIATKEHMISQVDIKDSQNIKNPIKENMILIAFLLLDSNFLNCNDAISILISFKLLKDLYDPFFNNYHENIYEILSYRNVPFEIIEALINKYPNIAEKTKGTEKKDLYIYPLHFAIKQNNCGVFHKLPISGENIIIALLNSFKIAASKKTIDGYYPLHLALNYGASTNVIKCILDAYPEAAKKIKTPRKDYYRYCKNSYNKLSYNLPLYIALKFNSPLEIIATLVEAYPEALNKNWGNKELLPINYAIMNKVSNEIINYLLDKCYDVIYNIDNLWGVSLLDFAIEWNVNINILNKIIDMYSNSPETSKHPTIRDKLTPIHNALESGKSDEIVKILIYSYLPWVKKRVYDLLPLHIALKKQYSFDIINTLLEVYPESINEKGKDIENNNKYELLLPLQFAIKYNCSEDIIDLLKI